MIVDGTHTTASQWKAKLSQKEAELAAAEKELQRLRTAAPAFPATARQPNPKSGSAQDTNDPLLQRLKDTEAHMTEVQRCVVARGVWIGF